MGRYLLTIIMLEVSLGILAQVDTMPESLFAFLTQLPFVAVLIWLDIQNKKWLEKMLSFQKETIKEVYTLMSSHIDPMTQEIAVLRATIKEAADDVERMVYIIEEKGRNGTNHNNKGAK